MKGKYVFLIVVMLLILLMRMSFFFQQGSSLKNGQQLVLKTRVTSVPEIVGGRQKLSIKTARNERVYVTTGLVPEIQYGDILQISGKVTIGEKSKRKFFTMYFPSLQIVKDDQNIISGFSTTIRRRASSLYAKSLSPTSAGLLNGIVFGGSQDLSSDFMDKLRVSGVVHVIAASGMNVTFVAGALIAVLGAVLRRQTALTIAILGILLYLCLTGFEASILRAAIMCILAFSASLLGRQNFAIGSVFLTGFLMLSFSPALFLDVGFQLSFLATLGILIIKPLLDGFFGSLGKVGELVSDDIATTIAAQIATIPILLGTFGSYGLLSILVNALILWTVPVLMIIGSIGLLFGFLFEPLGVLIIFLASPILWFFERVVSFFGGLGFTLTITSVSPAVWIGYYLLLVSVILLFSQKRAKNAPARENTH